MKLDLRTSNNPEAGSDLHMLKESLDIMYEEGLNALAHAGLVKRSASSGYAIGAAREIEDFKKIWNDPELLIKLTGGFGENQIGYSANAACKDRIAAREGMDSLAVTTIQGFGFLDQVPTQSDRSMDNLVYGDFPHGGAIFVKIHNIFFIIATSSMTQEQDCMAAGMLGGSIADAAKGLNLEKIFFG